MRTQSVGKRKAVAGSAAEIVKPRFFKFKGARIKVVVKDGESWWMLTDVCNALKFPHPSSAAAAVRGVSRVKFNVGKTANFINETDLFGFLDNTGKPLAAKFKEWAAGKIASALKGAASPQSVRKRGYGVDPLSSKVPLEKAYADAVALPVYSTPKAPVRIDDTHGDGGRVDARELWKALDVKSKFPDWFKARDLSLIQRKDFDLIPKAYTNKRGRGARKEYWLTINAAKEVCAMEKNNARASWIIQYLEDASNARELAGKVTAGASAGGRRWVATASAAEKTNAVSKAESPADKPRDFEAALEYLLAMERERKELEDVLQHKTETIAAMKKALATSV